MPKVTGGASQRVVVGNGYGIRDVDNVVRTDSGLIGNEVKVGYQSLSSRLIDEALKDAELLERGTFSSITWDFFRSDVTDTIGPSSSLQRELEQLGIAVAIH